METVGAGTGDDVGSRTQALPELGAGVVGENLELGDCIHGRLENESAIHAVEIIRAVDQEVIGLGPLAIHRVCLARAQRSSRFL